MTIFILLFLVHPVCVQSCNIQQTWDIKPRTLAFPLLPFPHSLPCQPSSLHRPLLKPDRVATGNFGNILERDENEYSVKLAFRVQINTLMHVMSQVMSQIGSYFDPIFRITALYK